MAYFGWIRKLILTGLAVLFLAGAAEIGLRMSTIWSKQDLRQKSAENPLLAPCWQAYYQLKPLTSLQNINPDTQLPVEVRVNEWGVRGGNIAIPKPPGTFRILNLGDESTLAPSTPESETFNAVLQQIMQPKMQDRLEVINAGVPGYCPLLGYLKLKHTLLTLQPDLVIFHFDMSDVADDYNVRRQLVLDEQGIAQVCPHPQLATAQQPQQQFCEQLMLIKRGTQLWAEKVSKTDILQERLDIGAPLGNLSWTLDNPPDWTQYINHAYQPLMLMNELVQSSQAMFVVSSIPKPWQVSASACNEGGKRASVGLQRNKLYSNQVPFQSIANYCRTHNIRHVSVTEDLKAQPQPEGLFLNKEAEYSVRGHQVYAHLLATQLYRQYASPQTTQMPARTTSQ